MANSSMIQSLLDPTTPTFLFGCTPPSSSLAPGKVSTICKKFVERGRVLAVDGFIVYDVQDESSRTPEKRPFPFRTLHDSSWYAGLVTSESGKPCVVYKAAPCCGNFDEWLSDCVKKDGHTALTIVGAPSSKGSHPGPTTKTACQRVVPYKGVHFGCVCIAERHVKHRCEHEILIKKMQWGAEWFITQGIYDPNPMISVIKDYSRKCRELKIKPKKIILTFTPCGRRKTMSFIKWLGMQVPEDIERRIFGCLETEIEEYKETKMMEQKQEAAAAAAASPGSKKKKKKKKDQTPVEISCEIMCENLMAILAETSTCGVPLGINVESVSGYRDEIDATHELFRSLQSIMLNNAGIPWVVRWHPLEVSARRRDRVLTSAIDVVEDASGEGSKSKKNMLLIVAGVSSCLFGLYAACDSGSSTTTRTRDCLMATTLAALCLSQGNAF